MKTVSVQRFYTIASPQRLCYQFMSIMVDPNWNQKVPLIKPNLLPLSVLRHRDGNKALIRILRAPLKPKWLGRMSGIESYKRKLCETRCVSSFDCPSSRILTITKMTEQIRPCTVKSRKCRPLKIKECVRPHSSLGCKTVHVFMPSSYNFRSKE